jgi:hypothetical protein
MVWCLPASLEGYDKGEDIEVLRSKYKEAYPHNDTNRIIVWAGAGVGQMNEIKPAKASGARYLAGSYCFNYPEIRNLSRNYTKIVWLT